MTLQIRSRITGNVLFEGEAANLRELVIKAVSSRADLSGANLSGANLYGANLSGQHLISFAGIGSARRSTTYWVEADEVRCGCFTGTLEEFAEQVEETHEDNPKHLAEYQAGIAFLKACVAAIPAEEAEEGRKKYAEMKAKKEAKDAVPA